MTIITYHTWKRRQQFARLVLLTALALAILPTIAFGSKNANPDVAYPLGVTSFPLLTAPMDKEPADFYPTAQLSLSAEPVPYAPPLNKQ